MSLEDQLTLNKSRRASGISVDVGMDEIGAVGAKDMRGGALRSSEGCLIDSEEVQ